MNSALESLMRFGKMRLAALTDLQVNFRFDEHDTAVQIRNKVNFLFRC